MRYWTKNMLECISKITIVCNNMHYGIVKMGIKMKEFSSDSKKYTFGFIKMN